MVGDKLLFEVSLINGNVTAVTREVSGPYTYYDNIYQAEFCGLGIAIQNMSENAYKDETAIESQSYHLSILDNTSSYTAEQAKEIRIKIREEYEQYFISFIFINIMIFSFTGIIIPVT